MQPPQNTPRTHTILWIMALLVCLLVPAARTVRAQAPLPSAAPPLRMGLIVGEPFGHFGWMMPQGHASIYLSGVCAATPVSLRPCGPGEHGVVVSRLHDLKQAEGKPQLDWIAVPFVPFLYGVDDPAEAPHFVTAPFVNELREQYRLDHLRAAVPDRIDKHGNPGPAKAGDWNETVGATFDRRILLYLFDITPEQQAAILDRLQQPNISHYSVARHNCADFVWEMLNNPMPGVLHRNFWADFDMMTPKQLAWQTDVWLREHTELHPAILEIPQIAGSLPRSRPIRGAAQSLITNRLYFAVVLVAQPELMLADAIIYQKDGKWTPGLDAKRIEPAYWSKPPQLALQEAETPATSDPQPTHAKTDDIATPENQRLQ